MIRKEFYFKYKGMIPKGYFSDFHNDLKEVEKWIEYRTAKRIFKEIEFLGKSGDYKEGFVYLGEKYAEIKKKWGIE